MHPDKVKQSDKTITDLRAFTKAPIFIADPVSQYLEDSKTAGFSARTILFSLCGVVESTIKFATVVAALDVIAAQPDKRAPIWLGKLALENLGTPTLGRWLGFLRGLVEAKAWPDFFELAPTYDALASLAPAVVTSLAPEWTSLISLRNAIAHGVGISNPLAAQLLAHWTPRVETAFAELSWLVDTELWVRYEEGFRLLNGADANVSAVEPPDFVVSLLPVGGLAVRRKDEALLLQPFSRHAPVRKDGAACAQFFARRLPTGILYTLFGTTDALQAMGGPDELDALYRLFDFTALRRMAEPQAFVEAGYDAQLESEASQFVGREQARSTLFDAVNDTIVRGIVFVKGPAGIGKSALLSRVAVDLRIVLAKRADAGASNERLLAYRFLAGDRGCAPLPFLRWMIERMGMLCGKRVEPKPEHGLFDLRQMALSLLASAPVDRILLVLDNLDEIAREHKNFILGMIAQLAKIEKLLVIVGTRPEKGLPEALANSGGASPFPDGLGDMSKTDIRVMLTEFLPAVTRRLIKQDIADAKLANPFIDAIAERADGLPLYVKLVIDSIMRGNVSLEQATKPDWLPSQLTSFLRELTTTGPFSDKAKLTPMIGCLLAVAREPLTAHEIGAFLVRSLSPAVAARMTRGRGIEPFEHRRRIANEVLSDLGGLLRSGVGPSGDQRFRLLHEQLTRHLLTSEDVADTLAEVTELVIAAASDPGTDAVASYFFRNGIAHMLEAPQSRSEEAVRLLTDFQYQVRRLEALAVSGGDGGLRDDWKMVSECADAIDDRARTWRTFWATEGPYFQRGVGRDAPCEFLERALNYAPDTPIGQSAASYLADAAGHHWEPLL